MSQQKVKKRHNQILNALKSKEEVQISDLAEQLDCHEMTIRRDLKTLEEMGYVIRTLRGARLIPYRFLGFSSEDEIRQNIHLKQPIAKYIARNLIKEQDRIFLGPGTTVIALMQELHELEQERDKNNFPAHSFPLSIFTNSVDLISFEYKNHVYGIHVVGGKLQPDSTCLFGDLAKQQFAQLKVDKIFIEVDSVVLDEDFEGLMVLNNMESSIMPEVLKITEAEIYIIADATKFEKFALYTIGPLSGFKAIITNVLKPEIKDKFKGKIPLIEVNAEANAA